MPAKASSSITLSNVIVHWSQLIKGYPFSITLETTFLLHYVHPTVPDYSQISAIRTSLSSLFGVLSLVFQSILSVRQMAFRGFHASIPRHLSAETRLGDGVTLNGYPRTGTIVSSCDVFRLVTRKSAISQLRWIVVFERPPLSRCRGWTLLHDQPLLALRYCQTLVATSVPDLFRLKEKSRWLILVNVRRKERYWSIEDIC